MCHFVVLFILDDTIHECALNGTFINRFYELCGQFCLYKSFSVLQNKMFQLKDFSVLNLIIYL